MKKLLIICFVCGFIFLIVRFFGFIISQEENKSYKETKNTQEKIEIAEDNKELSMEEECIKAIENADFTKVKELLDKGVNINFKKEIKKWDGSGNGVTEEEEIYYVYEYFSLIDIAHANLLAIKNNPKKSAQVTALKQIIKLLEDKGCKTYQNWPQF